MNDAFDDERLVKKLKPLQIVAIGLMLGLLSTTAVMALMVYQFDASPNVDLGFPMWIIPAIQAVVTTLIVIPSIEKSLGGTMVKSIADGTWSAKNPEMARKFPDDSSKLFAVLMALTMIRFALMEGAGVIAAVFFFIEAKPAGLAVVAGILFWLYTQFPTRNRVRDELETLERELQRRRDKLDS